MVEWIEGDDIFAVEANAYVITVNCIGVMGAGVAKAFKEREPELYLRYKKDCKDGKIQIGKGLVYMKEPRLYYVMFPTKDNWRNDSTYSGVMAGLNWFIQDHLHPDAHIVFPPLGCGHGGLKFNMVSLLMNEAFKNMRNRITVVHPWHSSPHPDVIIDPN